MKTKLAKLAILIGLAFVLASCQTKTPMVASPDIILGHSEFCKHLNL